MAETEQTALDVVVGETVGRVSALLARPTGARGLYVLAHGAGAGMRHPFLEAVARALADRQIATLRYQFPYIERREGRPNPPGVLEATVRAAVRAAAAAAPGLPLVAGGKSLGGRMTSSAAARQPLDGVQGLVFLGFPLHPPKRPSSERAEHLDRVSLPMLFLQGTRDDLADLSLLEPVCRRLGPRATLHVVEGADHSFRVLKRSGRTDAQVLDELTGAVAGWLSALEPARVG